MAAIWTYKKHSVVLYNDLRSRINSSCPKADVKGIYRTTSSWLIVRLPLVSYVKVTYGSNINFRKLELINPNLLLLILLYK